MMKILPPLKRNWKSGTTQIGLFIRSPNGSVIEMSVDSASDLVAESASALLREMVGNAAVKP